MTCAYHETALHIFGVEWEYAEHLDAVGDELRCFYVTGAVNVSLPGSVKELWLSVEGVPVTGEIHPDPDDRQWDELSGRQTVAALAAAQEALPLPLYVERETGDILRVYEEAPGRNRIESLSGYLDELDVSNEEVNRRFLALNPLRVDTLASGRYARD